MNILKLISNTKYVYTERPTPVAGTLRTEWRCAIILLILDTVCRKKKSSLFKLHLFNWSLKSNDNAQIVINILKGEVKPYVATIRFDPYLIRALMYLISTNLINRVGSESFSLTDLGQQIAGEMLSDDELFIREKYMLSSLKAGEVSEAHISKLFKVGSRGH